MAGHVRAHRRGLRAGIPRGRRSAWRGTHRCRPSRSSIAISGELLARFYTDLFPREGKYGHAAAFPLVIAHERADGTREVPVSAIVANFTPPIGRRAQPPDATATTARSRPSSTSSGTSCTCRSRGRGSPASPAPRRSGTSWRLRPRSWSTGSGSRRCWRASPATTATGEPLPAELLANDGRPPAT